MNEEAGFIAALLAAPDDRTTVLVYADWLDERADPRAAYLRQLADGIARPHRGANVDFDWVMLLKSLHFGPGCRVKWGANPPDDAEFTTIAAERRGVSRLLRIRCRSDGLDFAYWHLVVG